jgi:hypothetical protein
VSTEAATKRLLRDSAWANDRAAAASLEQGCGVLLKSANWRTLNAEDHGGDSIPSRMVILRQETAPDWWKARAITEALTVKTEKRLAVACLTELAAKTAAPKTDDGSAEIKFDVFLRELLEYPPDVVRDVLRGIANEVVFFPAWKELYTRLEIATAWRRCAHEAVLDAMQRQGLLT